MLVERGQIVLITGEMIYGLTLWGNIAGILKIQVDIITM